MSSASPIRLHFASQRHDIRPVLVFTTQTKVLQSMSLLKEKHKVIKIIVDFENYVDSEKSQPSFTIPKFLCTTAVYCCCKMWISPPKYGWWWGGGYYVWGVRQMTGEVTDFPITSNLIGILPAWGQECQDGSSLVGCQYLAPSRMLDFRLLLISDDNFKITSPPHWNFDGVMSRMPG